LDGFIKGDNGEPDVGWEVHGCVWHACPVCIKDPNEMLPSGKTAAKVREDHNKRIEFIKLAMPNFELKEIWEHEIIAYLKQNPKKAEKYRNFIITTPWFRFRDGFFGGRTQPFRIFFNAENNVYNQKFTIRYLDFTSLYPWAQTQEYPIGHPKVINIPADKRDVYWQKAEQIPWKGFIKVIILPPKQLNSSPPVLALKIDQRLLFPLCRKCAEDYPNGGKLIGYNCLHADEQRSFVWSGTTIELAEALKQDYVVIKVYSGLEYEEFSNSIFKGFVADLMALKIHASGFDGIEDPDEQDIYILENKSRFNIIIDKNKMKPDAAKRSLSKLTINANWGKFAQNDNLTKSIVTDSPCVLRKIS